MQLIGDDRLPGLMKTIMEVPAVRISEQVFVTRFLPMFVNMENKPVVDLTPWLEITNPCCPVDVHANNDENDILFRVPPLLDTRATPFEHGVDKESLSSLVYKAEQFNADRPGYGNEYLNAKLRESLLPQESARLDIALQWNYIRERYGYPTLNIGTQVKVGGDNAKPANVDDVFEDL